MQSVAAKLCVLILRRQLTSPQLSAVEQHGLPQKYAIYAIRQLFQGQFCKGMACWLLSPDKFQSLLGSLYHVSITPPAQLFPVHQYGRAKATMEYKLCDAVYCSAGSLFLSPQTPYIESNIWSGISFQRYTVDFSTTFCCGATWPPMKICHLCH